MFAVRESKLTRVPPSYATKNVKNGRRWLETKRQDDSVDNGLWRIHDTLYDLTDFINKHPGGADWISMTKGQDITEAVESHHIYQDRLKPYLERYKVGNATRPRNSRFTFAKDGFYVTLRKRVAAELPKLKINQLKMLSKCYIDGLFILTLILSVITLRRESYLLALLCGVTNTWTSIAGHNFLHQRDNYRMYYFNLSFQTVRDWRITHVLSHHMFPNSLLDFETLIVEPILDWMPSNKNWIQRYASWLYSPIVYTGFYYVEIAKKVYTSICEENHLAVDDAIPFVLAIAMYLFGGGVGVGMVLKWFLVIMTVSSFAFAVIGLNAGHHHPDNVHDGDAIRGNLDWGLYNMDATIDRKEFRRKTILAITNFGDHALHHMFPTLDHAVLPYLYDILFETLIEFEAEAKEYPFWELVRAQFQQLRRNEPMTKCAHERLKAKDSNAKAN